MLPGIAGKTIGYSKKERILIGSLTVPQVSSTLAVALVAYESINAAGERLIDDAILNSILVLMVVTAVAGTILTEFIGKRILQEQKKNNPYCHEKIPVYHTPFRSCCLSFKKGKSASPQTEAFNAERNAFFEYLKKPEDARLQLKPVGSFFDSSLLNDPKQVYQYAGNEVKAAANLGIYLADLNYCVLFGKSHFTQKYFGATVELSNIVGIEKTALTFLEKRYAENMARPDSVQAIVDSLFARSVRDRKGTQKEKLAGIAMATYQIENLHLALRTLESLPESLTEDQQQTATQLVNMVVRQHSNIMIIYNFVRTFSDPNDPDKNPNYPFFDNALRELIGVYQKIDYVAPLDKGRAIALRNDVVSKNSMKK